MLKINFYSLWTKFLVPIPPPPLAKKDIIHLQLVAKFLVRRCSSYCGWLVLPNFQLFHFLHFLNYFGESKMQSWSIWSDDLRLFNEKKILCCTFSFYIFNFILFQMLKICWALHYRWKILEITFYQNINILEFRLFQWLLAHIKNLSIFHSNNGSHRYQLGANPGAATNTGLWRLRGESKVRLCIIVLLAIFNFREMFDLLNVNEAKGLTIYEIENGIVDMTQTGDLFDR